MQPIRFRSEQSINGVKIKRLAYGGGEKLILSVWFRINDGLIRYIAAQCNCVYLHALRDLAILVSGGFDLRQSQPAALDEGLVLVEVRHVVAGGVGELPGAEPRRPCSVHCWNRGTPPVRTRASAPSRSARRPAATGTKADYYFLFLPRKRLQRPRRKRRSERVRSCA